MRTTFGHSVLGKINTSNCEQLLVIEYLENQTPPIANNFWSLSTWENKHLQCEQRSVIEYLENQTPPIANNFLSLSTWENKHLQCEQRSVIEYLENQTPPIANNFWRSEEHTSELQSH